MLSSVVFVATLAFPASTIGLKGTVTDSTGAAIRRARLVVHWDSSGSAVGLKSNVGIKQDVTLETDEDGKFSADLPPGFYDVFVTAQAFSPQCQKIRIKPGSAAMYNPKLKVDPLVSSEIGDIFLPGD